MNEEEEMLLKLRKSSFNENMVNSVEYNREVQ